jgi:hypothetical protein
MERDGERWRDGEMERSIVKREGSYRKKRKREIDRSIIEREEE